MRETRRDLLSISATLGDWIRIRERALWSERATKRHKLQNFNQLLDLIFEDDRTSLYRGEREVRPPSAPTTRRLKSEIVAGELLVDDGPAYCYTL
jgi:hypothetical protein